jgi:hypothetical protein
MRRDRQPIGVNLLATIALTTLLILEPGVAATSATSATPTAAQCLVSPRSFEELSAILATPFASPAAESGAATVPEGTPAETATIAGITATLQELIACFNAGEVLRAYALYTPAYLREIFSNQDSLTRAAYGERATPHPVAPDEHAVLKEVRAARLFADGSAGAYGTIEYPLIPVPKTFFFTFVQVGDRWLIDGALGEISFSVP